jgi:hypothetical protein
MAEKRIKTIHDLGSSVQRLEVSAHDTDVLSRPQLLELLAGRTPVAGKVVNGANRHFSIACSLIGKMGAPFPGGLEDHGIRIIRQDDAVRLDGSRIDDKDIQMVAALAASLAYHAQSDR